MNYTVERLADEPIVIFTLGAGYDFEVDTATAKEELAAAMDEIAGDVYLITDYSAVHLEFQDLLTELQAETQGAPGSFTDPRVRRTILVGEDEMVGLAAESLYQTQYGKVRAIQVTSQEMAIQYARTLIRGLGE
jgi:hypothetical protein